jgi:membrane-bound acyltransferase YfiQ involved in biofilm formation
VATLIVVVAGGVYMTARAGRSLVWPIPLALLGVAAVLFVVNLVLLFTRAHRATYRFDVFWRVGGWAFLAYLVIGGMLEYVFVLDHLRGSRLAVITGLLALFIVDVPLILAFTVARYQAVTGGRAEAAPAPHLAPGPAGA